MKPLCYQCIHRQTAVGSAHTKCLHPGARGVQEEAEKDPITALRAMFGVPTPPADPSLKVVGDERGIASGWFAWPEDFDPVWLVSCSGSEWRAKPDSDQPDPVQTPED